METLEQERTRSGASNGKLTVLNPQGFPPRISPKDMAPCDDPDATGPAATASARDASRWTTA